MGGETYHRRSEGRGGGLSRSGQEEDREGEDFPDTQRERSLQRLLCHQSAYGRKAAGVDFRICACRLRYRRDNGCAGTRQPRLCVCKGLQSSDHPSYRRSRRERAELRCEGRHNDEFRLPQRNAGEGCHRGCQGLCRGSRSGPPQDQLPPSRRHILPSALLGRTFPCLFQGRHRLHSAGRQAASHPARDRRVQAYRRRRTSACKGKGLEVGRLSSGDQHNAWLRGVQRLLSPLYGSAQP